MERRSPALHNDRLALLGHFVTFYIVVWLVLNACGETQPSTGPSFDEDRTPWTRLSGKIVYVDYKGAGQYYLEVIYADTKTARNLATAQDHSLLYPAWNPEGSTIACGEGGIALIDERTCTRTEIAGGNQSTLHYCGFPTFSPDGKITYYSRSYASTIAECWVGDSLFLSGRNLHSTRAAWFPDGSALVVSILDSTNSAGLYKVDARTRAMTPLVTSTGKFSGTYFEWPQVSPDGNMLAFTAVKFSGSPSRAIWVTYADGSSPRWLTPDGTDDYYPCWSPDGTLIAFVRNGDVHIVSSDGASISRVTWNHNSGYPAWAGGP